MGYKLSIGVADIGLNIESINRTLSKVRMTAICDAYRPRSMACVAKLLCDQEPKLARLAIQRENMLLIIK